MQASERTLLLEARRNRNFDHNLSLFFAIICVVDVFGVFPIIALPKAIIDCGFYGIIIIIVVCCIQMYTAILLGRCWIMAEEIYDNITKKNRYPYSALAEFTYGSFLGNLVSILLDITVFGGGIPNLIVASQNLQFLGLRLTENTFDVSFCYWIIILGMILCPILWLGSPKDMKLLCTISVSIVISVFLLVAGCLIFSQPLSPDAGDNFNPDRPLWEIVFSTYGIISFQFDIHPSILTIQVDMKKKSQLPYVVIGGFAATLGMFSIITLLAAFKFGSAIKPSVLDTLPSSIFLHFAALFIAIQLCLTSAVSNSALYQHMEDCMSISRAFNHRRCILRTTLTLLGVLIAESVPRFDLVMSMIGGTLTSPLVFTLPPLFYLKMVSLYRNHEKKILMETFTNMVYSPEERSKSLSNYIDTQFNREFRFFGCISSTTIEIVFCIIIVIFSIFSTVITTYISIRNAYAYINFSQPCIYNVSSALINL